MNIQQHVKTFYEIIWNQHDLAAIPGVLHPDFSFRGSLGEYTQGHEGFIEYLNRIHNALDDYHCEIKEIVSEPPKVFTKMKFSGVHSNLLMGYSATGHNVSWDAAALFTFKSGKIINLWVLGDLHSLEPQLRD